MWKQCDSILVQSLRIPTYKHPKIWGTNMGAEPPECSRAALYVLEPNQGQLCRRTDRGVTNEALNRRLGEDLIVCAQNVGQDGSQNNQTKLLLRVQGGCHIIAK